MVWVTIDRALNRSTPQEARPLIGEISAAWREAWIFLSRSSLFWGRWQ